MINRAIDIKKIEKIKTNKGITIGELAMHGKVMLIFLRQFGCTFCRETLADIHKKRRAIEAEDTDIILIHQKEEDYARQVMEVYDVEGLHRISDPNLELYTLFGLKKAAFRQAFGIRVWIRKFSSRVFKGHLKGKNKGDGKQMPGVFILHNGKVLKSYRHKFTSDKPNYIKLAQCSLS